LREDDFESHQLDPSTGKGFYATYDAAQGGAASRGFVLGAFDSHKGDATFHQQVSLTAQTMRLRENFTGFLLDQQTPFQTPHEQRGDLIDLEASSQTVQVQGYGRERKLIETLAQEIELGYFGRIDLASNQQYRIRDSNGHPYYKEADNDATLGDVGLYVAVNAKLHDKVALRGGVRSDLFT